MTMKIKGVGLFMLAILLLAFTSQSEAQEFGDTLITSFVNDHAGVIDPKTSRYIENQSRDVLETLGLTIVFLTVDSLSPFTTIEQLSLAAAEQSDFLSIVENPSIIVVVALAERRVRIEVSGTAKAFFSDQTAGQILDEFVVPYLRTDNYPLGMRSASDAIAKIAIRSISPVARATEDIRVTSSSGLAGTLLYEVAPSAVFTIIGDSVVGTGFLISEDGLALTNWHVVDQADLRAQFCTNDPLPLEVLRRSEMLDLALVQVMDAPTVKLPLRNNLRIRPGDEVLVIGSPLGLGRSLSRGIVSAIRQSADVFYIQTDASVNPGSSGGPIFQLDTGYPIAIVTFKVMGEAEGIAFGISIDSALKHLRVFVSE